ncbi:MAG: ABC transporter permease [Pseudomonadales bacterium]
MSLLVTSQLRFLRRSPWSALTALIGMALGVASVVAVHLISAEVERTLNAGAPPHLAGLTHLLTRPDIDADDYFALRDWWRDHPRAPVRGLVPLLDGQLVVDGRGVQLIGADWLALPRGTDGPGAPLAISGEVLVGEGLIADADFGYRVGDRLTVGGRDLTVAGVLETGLGPALFADIGLAQRLLDVGPGQISLVGLAVVDPWAPWRRRLDRLMPGFGAGLPQPGAAPLTRLLDAGAGSGIDAAWRARPVTAERPSAAFARSVLFNLGALGTLALLVAWFLIYQVGAIWLRRQHLVLTRLQMVGADPRLLRRSFLALFVGLGLAATVLGGLVGVLLATLLVKLSSAGIDASLAVSAARALDPWVMVKAVGSGFGVCLVGGYAAFVREWRPAAGPARWRWLALCALALLVLLGITLERSGVLGGFLAILAMSLLAVLLVTPLLGLLRHAGRGRLLTRLALREVAWYPRVLDVALAALTLAVATGIGVGLMVDSFRSDFQRMLDVRLAGDLYLYGVGDRQGALADWLLAQPEVAEVRRFGEARSRLDGVPVALGYAEFDARESARYGFPRHLETGEALVNERLLRDLDLDVGDQVRGARGVNIVGAFPGFGDPQGRVLVDVTSLDRFGVPARFDRLAVNVRAAADVAALIGRLTERFPALTVEARTTIRAVALRIFDRTFAITRALTLLALLVAVVGTYNALTALRLNQAATAELLRAQGVTSAESRHIALVRAGTLGGVAVALALPLGIAMAWTLCAVVNPRSFGWSVALQLPPAGWLPPLLLGIVAALLAGLLPAPRERGALHDAG